MALPGSWQRALSKVVGESLRNNSAGGDGLTTPMDIGTFTSLVHGLLIQNIMASVMPEGAKQAIISAVSGPMVTSATTGIIHIDHVIRPSVFANGAGGKTKHGSFSPKFTSADLVMVYNQRGAPGHGYYPVGVYDTGRVKWARMTGIMSVAINNNFLERTVAEGNALSPYGIVTMV